VPKNVGFYHVLTEMPGGRNVSQQHWERGIRNVRRKYTSLHKNSFTRSKFPFVENISAEIEQKPTSLVIYNEFKL
jgi:hypothetical protein